MVLLLLQCEWVRADTSVTSVTVFTVGQVLVVFARGSVRVQAVFIIGYVRRSQDLQMGDKRLVLRRFRNSGGGALAGFPFRGLLTLFVVNRVAIAAPLVSGYGGCKMTLIIVGPGLHPIFF